MDGVFNANFEIGDRVIYKPINYTDKSQDTENRYYGTKGTVIGLDTLRRMIISLDEFPECNNRKWRNSHWVNGEELEKIENDG